MLANVWPMLKSWRTLGLGPVEFVFSFRRRARRTRGTAVAGSGPRPRAEAPAVAERVHPGTAVVVGAGPGLGHAMARLLAREGFDLILVTRDAAGNRDLAHELAGAGGRVETIGADVTDEAAVLRLFEAVEAACGVPALVVYSLQDTGPGQTVEITLPAFESAWRHNCLGAFLVGRSAARLMTRAGRGTLVFIGSTSSIIGRAGHLNLAVGKFGQRALAQVLAREMWPLGVHVAHLMIDADIREPEAGAQPHPQACPDEIAQSVLALHRQPRTAWSSELDLRPWNESFWNHC